MPSFIKEYWNQRILQYESKNTANSSGPAT